MVCFIPCQGLRSTTENPSQSISFGEWMDIKSSICGRVDILLWALFYVGVFEWAAVGFKVTPLGQHLWSWLMTNTCECGERLCHDLLNRWQTSPFGCPSHHSSWRILCPSTHLLLWRTKSMMFSFEESSQSQFSSQMYLYSALTLSEKKGTNAVILNCTIKVLQRTAY